MDLGLALDRVLGLALDLGWGRVGFDIIGQVPVAVAVTFQDILIGPKINETAGIAQRKRSIPSPVFTSVIASSDCGLTPVS